MSFRLHFVLTAFVLVLVAGCASTGATSDPSDRQYAVSYDQTVAAIEQVLRNMDMVIESSDHPTSGSTILVVRFTNAVARSGSAGSPNVQGLTIQVNRLMDKQTRVRVEAHGAQQYGAHSPHQHRDRFFRLLNQELEA
jgi:outer membrane murein-binding lipoprotein Lpp